MFAAFTTYTFSFCTYFIHAVHKDDFNNRNAFYRLSYIIKYLPMESMSNNRKALYRQSEKNQD